MPPKPKFAKEDVVQAGLAIVKEQGMDHLSARALAQELGSSSCPIFTVFGSMDEVREAVLDEAKHVYAEYVKWGLTQTPAFKGAGTAYIRFAMEEPKLFTLLFMRELPGTPDIDSVLPRMDDNYDQILDSIIDTYGLSQDVANRLYEHLTIYTHGIATLCVTRMCRFTSEQISAMLTEVFTGLLVRAKKGELHA